MPAPTLGVVYLVGAGPSDPALITERAAFLVERADVVLHDERIDRAILKRAKAGAEVINVGKRGDRPSDKQAKQSEIEGLLVHHARAGKNVVRLKGGDPYLFGRGSEEAEALQVAGIRFEVVPGVTSPVAAAAYAGISLTHRDLASSVTFVSGTKRDGATFDFAELARVSGTVCVLMAHRRLEAICQAMIDVGGRAADTPAAVIEQAASPRQKIVEGTLGDIAQKTRAAQLGTPSILVVGKVVKLRDRLRWYDAFPLFGARVLVARAAHQAQSTVELLRRRGAEPIELPLISIAPPPDTGLIARAIAALPETDIAIFTSENGVRTFFDALEWLGKDTRALGGVRVAAIGTATARALEVKGVRADVVPSVFRGEELAEAILADVRARHPDITQKRALIARALVARDVVPDTLRAAGMIVDVVPVYETHAAGAQEAERLRSMIDAGELDAVLLTSPSTVNSLCDLLGDDAAALLSRVAVASIGSVTSDAARKRGLEPAVTAEVSTMEGLVDALETWRTVR